MKRTTSSTGRQGFTLIELLAVVAIILLLFTLISPQISKARFKAKMVQQSHHARSIVEAILAKESGSRFSKGWPQSGDTNTTTSTEYLVSLVEGGYLDVDYSFFAGPNMRPAIDRDDFESNGDECNSWIIVLDLNDGTKGNLPAVYQRNYEMGSSEFSDEFMPTGLKGFAFATKNGEAVVVEPADMEDDDAFRSIFHLDDFDDLGEVNLMEP
ncbi:type II secretion system protein [Pontiella sp.]|uniref:type II secretion system protein n=1 Tax=Pontiella sp. TaxID=2837462 RepID=UPI0035614DC8